MGAYTSFLVASSGAPVLVSLLVAPLVVGLIALLLEPVFFRHLYGRPMESILATWGLSLALQQGFQLIFGSGYQSVPYPTDAAIDLLGTSFSLYRLLLIGLAVLLGAALLLVEKRTRLGTLARATMSNAALASTLGVNITRVYMGTLVFGAALAGLAGAVVAPLTSAYPTMGLNFLTNSFFAVLVGGLGSLPGLIFSSGALGASQGIVAIAIDPVWGSIALVLVALVLVRIRRTV
jgi:branched-chain amino acid transport system permease protein/urea transport system permease protein